MRVFVIASLIAIAYSARVTKLAPRFSLVEERSFNGAPIVSIAFPDGYEDELVLSKFHANDEDRMANKDHCNFIGHLANEPEACVAMTGCIGSEDVDFTILSAHATESPLFKWTKEGHVEIIESGLKNGLNGRMDMLEIPKEDRDDGITENGDEDDIDEFEPAFLANEANLATTLPATQHLQIRVGVDDGFKNQVGTTAQIEAYMNSVWAHLQTNYCHSSLGSKVLVERLPGIKHYAGKTLKSGASGSASLKSMYTDTTNDIGSADLMLYMGFIGTGYSQGGGIAYRGVVCIPDQYKYYKQSINCYGSNMNSMGELLAHELGHNLGMEHDFSSNHGGNGSPGSGGPCDYKGFMSYGDSLSVWSACSVKDFTAHHQQYKSNWCMPAASSACGGSSGGTTAAPAPTPAPTTAAPTCASVGGKAHWIKDSWCDDENNNAACQFDGGDCCNNSKPNWNYYCKKCECKSSSG